MQIGEDDRDRNLEANHRKGTEAKPRPFVSGETSKTISFWRLDCLPTTGEPMGGADRFKYSSCLPATVDCRGLGYHSFSIVHTINKRKGQARRFFAAYRLLVDFFQPSLSACAALRPLVVLYGTVYVLCFDSLINFRSFNDGQQLRDRTRGNLAPDI